MPADWPRFPSRLSLRDTSRTDDRRSTEQAVVRVRRRVLRTKGTDCSEWARTADLCARNTHTLLGLDNRLPQRLTRLREQWILLPRGSNRRLLCAWIGNGPKWRLYHRWLPLLLLLLKGHLLWGREILNKRLLNLLRGWGWRVGRLRLSGGGGCLRSSGYNDAFACDNHIIQRQTLEYFSNSVVDVQAGKFDADVPVRQ